MEAVLKEKHHARQLCKLFLQAFFCDLDIIMARGNDDLCDDCRVKPVDCGADQRLV